MPQKLTWDGGGGIMKKPKPVVEEIIDPSKKALPIGGVDLQQAIPSKPVPSPDMGGQNLQIQPAKTPVAPIAPVTQAKPLDPYADVVSRGLQTQPLAKEYEPVITGLAQGQPVDTDTREALRQIALSNKQSPQIASLMVRLAQGQPVDDKTAQAIYQLAQSPSLSPEQADLITKLASLQPMNEQQANNYRLAVQSPAVSPDLSNAIASLSSKTSGGA